jgi:hypothetical protein
MLMHYWNPTTQLALHLTQQFFNLQVCDSLRKLVSDNVGCLELATKWFSRNETE